METETTGIFAILTGENYKIKNVVEYQSKDLRGLEKEAKTKEDLDKL